MLCCGIMGSRKLLDTFTCMSLVVGSRLENYEHKFSDAGRYWIRIQCYECDPVLNYLVILGAKV